MNKLTKEQAEELIKELIKFTETKDGASAVWYIDTHTIRKVINQCTEQEFPSFEFDDCLDNDVILKLQEIYTALDIDVVSHISFYVYYKNKKTIDCSMQINKFKKFTDGCVKICKWLEEHASD